MRRLPKHHPIPRQQLRSRSHAPSRIARREPSANAAPFNPHRPCPVGGVVRRDLNPTPCRCTLFPREVVAGRSQYARSAAIPSFVTIPFQTNPQSASSVSPGYPPPTPSCKSWKNEAPRTFKYSTIASSLATHVRIPSRRIEPLAPWTSRPCTLPKHRQLLRQIQSHPPIPLPNRLHPHPNHLTRRNQKCPDPSSYTPQSEPAKSPSPAPKPAAERPANSQSHPAAHPAPAAAAPLPATASTAAPAPAVPPAQSPSAIEPATSGE